MVKQCPIVIRYIYHITNYKSCFVKNFVHRGFFVFFNISVERKNFLTCIKETKKQKKKKTLGVRNFLRSVKQSFKVSLVHVRQQQIILYNKKKHYNCKIVLKIIG